MTDELALLRAIRAARDDDTPRLVYADWLDEHGDSARAEFVRVQCWLSANDPEHQDWEQTWEREHQLLEEHREKWSRPFGGMVDSDFPFDRGFPSWFRVNSPFDFVCFGENLGQHSATDRLMIDWVYDAAELSQMLREPAVSWVRELWLGEWSKGLDADSFRGFCRTDRVQQLRRLDVSHWYHLNHTDTRFLAESDALPELEHVALALNWPADVSAVIRLLESPHRERLHGLSVPYFHDADVDALCASDAVARLTHLALLNNSLTDRAAERLAACPRLDALQMLTIGVVQDGMSNHFQDILRKRFGEHVWLSQEIEGSNPVQQAYFWHSVTGRAL